MVIASHLPLNIIYVVQHHVQWNVQFNCPGPKLEEDFWKKVDVLCFSLHDALALISWAIWICEIFRPKYLHLHSSYKYSWLESTLLKNGGKISFRLFSITLRHSCWTIYWWKGTEAWSNHTFATVAHCGEAVEHVDCKICKHYKIKCQGLSKMAVILLLRYS